MPCNNEEDIFFDDAFTFPSDSFIFKINGMLTAMIKDSIPSFAQVLDHLPEREEHKFPSSRVHIFYDDDKTKSDDDCHFSTVIRFSSSSEPGKNATVRKTSTTTKIVDGKKVVTKRTENDGEEVIEVLEDGELKSRTVNPSVAVTAAK
ncbi:unnamed protein product [Angiostrongylus costaricensis]|uniref:Uncharacterized protein n=1 Tax=Angiostrongylus costaricensis TaxID=334426 RepID=A0A158PFM2_ANGCS|nr:unnamed protein product [Angiostrongylus costaricensis]